MIYVLAPLLDLTDPPRIAGALISLLSTTPSIICFLGVAVPCARLLARPLRSLICARASSRERMPLPSDNAAGGVESTGSAKGIRVVVLIVWKVGIMPGR